MKCNKNGIKKEGESCKLNNNCIYPNCMKPTKQTVYLPVEITEEFWKKYDNNEERPDYELIDANNGERLDEWVNKHEGYFFTPEQLNEYTASVIKQALETAAKTRRNGFYNSNKEEPSDPNELNEFGLLVFKHKTNKRLFLQKAYRWVDRLILLDETEDRQIVDSYKFSTYNLGAWEPMTKEEFNKVKTKFREIYENS